MIYGSWKRQPFVRLPREAFVIFEGALFAGMFEADVIKFVTKDCCPLLGGTVAYGLSEAHGNYKIILLYFTNYLRFAFTTSLP